MPRSFTRAALVLLALTAALVVAACGGSAGTEKSAKETLASVKPLSSAQVNAAAAHLLRQRPARGRRQARAHVQRPAAQQRRGQAPQPRLEDRLLRAHDQVHLAASSRRATTSSSTSAARTSRPAARPSPAHRPGARGQAEGRLRRRARPARRGQGRQEGRRGDGRGAKATSYTGAIDLDKVMDQYERLSQSLPTTGAAAAVPQGRLTPEQRAQVKRTFGSPRFEAAIAEDDTVRRLVLTTSSPPPRSTARAPAGSPAGASSTASSTPTWARRRRSSRPRTRSRSGTSPASCSASSAVV